jgi:hypothetical protein
MKKQLAFILLVILVKGAFPQCASDYVGIYGVRGCSQPDTITSYFCNAIVTEITPNQILISNFHGIPNSIIGNCEDTIVADLNCQFDSLTLVPVSYQVSGGYLSYSGSGTLLTDSIVINYHQINPDFQQDICLVYKKGIIVNTDEELRNESTINIWPNPATHQINIEQNNLEIVKIEIIDMMGVMLKSYPELKKTIDISGLSNGIYFVKITTGDNKIKIRKILKN